MARIETKRERYVTSEPIQEDLKENGALMASVAVKLVEGYKVKNKWLNNKMKNGTYVSEIEFVRVFNPNISKGTFFR